RDQGRKAPFRRPGRGASRDPGADVTVEPVAVDKVLQWTGGSVLQRGSARSVTSVSTDSRTLRAGACFVALAGERFDGHDFAADAAARGAAAVVVRRDKP